MARKKHLLAVAARWSGMFAVNRALSTLRTDRLTVLAYHRVMPVLDVDRYPFDIELISAQPEAFRWQMQFVAQNFNPVTIDQVVRNIMDASPLPRRAVLVTFDDGFSDNYDHAFPILRDVGVPACMFVSTEVMGGERTFWFDYVAHILMRAPAHSIVVGGDVERLPTDDTPASRRIAIHTTLRWLKSVSDAERLQFMDELRRDFSGYVDPGATELSRSMTWDQIREMSRAGIDFGSHGATHGLLAKLAAEQLDREIVESKRRLEFELSKRICAISYPVGGPGAFSDIVVDKVRSAGYEIGFTYMVGVNDLSNMDRFYLRRQHVELGASREYFEGLLTYPSFFR